MSHDLLLDPGVAYADLLADLPEGIRVVQRYGPTGRGLLDCVHKSRLLPEGFEHVLLADICGNTLWCHPAYAHDIQYGDADDLGEAAFDHYGLQGSAEHFVAAFAERGLELYDACDCQTYDYGPCKRCHGENRKMMIPGRSLLRVGFWRPVPNAVESSGLLPAILAHISVSAFLGGDGALPSAEEAVDPTWDDSERRLVLRHLAEVPTLVAAEYGSSSCRICSQENGNKEYSDGVYLWPEGFAHYLKDHAVKPPRAFIDHVLAYRAREPARQEKT